MHTSYVACLPSPDDKRKRAQTGIVKNKQQEQRKYNTAQASGEQAIKRESFAQSSFALPVRAGVSLQARAPRRSTGVVHGAYPWVHGS